MALERGQEVTLADNWYATRREQLAGLEERGAAVETIDIRDRGQVEALLARPWSRVLLLAAQASRPLSVRGSRVHRSDQCHRRATRRRARRGAGRPTAVPSHVYGTVDGPVGPAHPYGAQGDLAHLSKVYAEQCLAIYAQRRGYPLAILRLGIVYGPSPVEHDRPESVTVVDKFRRLAVAGELLPVDDAAATIGVVHVEDAARILLEAPESTIENVAAETVTVGYVAALALGEEPQDGARCAYESSFEYRHRLADYLARPA